MIWPEANNAQNSMAAVSAQGSAVCVLIRRLNSSCRRPIAFGVRIDDRPWDLATRALHDVVLGVVTEAPERHAAFDWLGFGWDQRIDAALFESAEGNGVGIAGIGGDRFDADPGGCFGFVHLDVDHLAFIRLSSRDLNVENDAGFERQDQINPGCLAFIDETWIKTNMEPLRGGAPLGERLIAKVPHGHWKTSAFIAAQRCGRIEAPRILDGPVNGAAFKTHVEKVLASTPRPGDLVIMDNPGSHEGKAVRQAIRAAGAKLLFLLKCSPDMNPVEQVFAKLKHFLRAAAARAIVALTAAAGEILGAFTPEECANCFANSGYAKPKVIPL